jgi:hypothetical protein
MGIYIPADTQLGAQMSCYTSQVRNTSYGAKGILEQAIREPCPTRPSTRNPAIGPRLTSPFPSTVTLHMKTSEQISTGQGSLLRHSSTQRNSVISTAAPRIPDPGIRPGDSQIRASAPPIVRFSAAHRPGKYNLPPGKLCSRASHPMHWPASAKAQTAGRTRRKGSRARYKRHNIPMMAGRVTGPAR